MAGGIGARRLGDIVTDDALQFLHREAPALHRALKSVAQRAREGLGVHLALMLHLCGKRHSAVQGFRGVNPDIDFLAA